MRCLGVSKCQSRLHEDPCFNVVENIFKPKDDLNEGINANLSTTSNPIVEVIPVDIEEEGHHNVDPIDLIVVNKTNLETEESEDAINVDPADNEVDVGNELEGNNEKNVKTKFISIRAAMMKKVSKMKSNILVPHPPVHLKKYLLRVTYDDTNMAFDTSTFVPPPTTAKEIDQQSASSASQTSNSDFVVEVINRLKELLAASEPTSLNSAAFPPSHVVVNIHDARLSKPYLGYFVIISSC
ncbi:hypothetical protein RIF29_37904 [Crotalaria pallida]|uniref:Uncharacterized protein n=1 Tax=Crotalaria pallida TaxID=3830 RepID=A0AAN9DY86_CROPI